MIGDWIIYIGFHDHILFRFDVNVYTAVPKPVRLVCEFVRNMMQLDSHGKAKAAAVGGEVVRPIIF